VYAREVEGRELTFGVSGKLIRNVLVMVDRQTGSYWSQLLGEAVEGEMVGARLDYVTSWMTTWREWKERNPNTIALDKAGRRGSRDVYDDYFASPRAGVIGETVVDDRLPTKANVIGVAGGGEAVAYPFGVLREQPVVNDVVGGQPLLVAFDVENLSGVVYDRTVDGQRLTFAGGPAAGTLTDAETGTTWNAFTGQATSGPLAGQRLGRVPSTRAFWFGWKDFYPDTRVYGDG
jgi:hypothetical protein